MKKASRLFTSHTINKNSPTVQHVQSKSETRSNETDEQERKTAKVIFKKQSDKSEFATYE